MKRPGDIPALILLDVDATKNLTLPCKNHKVRKKLIVSIKVVKKVRVQWSCIDQDYFKF